MRRFADLKVGDVFHSTCSISKKELEAYLDFARIRNRFLEANGMAVPGRAVISRMEGEFTRLSHIYGNEIVLVGSDGDKAWGGRSVRFPAVLHVDEVLDIEFTISGKEDGDGYGRIHVDFVGTRGGETVVVSRKNIYRLTK